VLGLEGSRSAYVFAIGNDPENNIKPIGVTEGVLQQEHWQKGEQ